MDVPSKGAYTYIGSEYQMYWYRELSYRGKSPGSSLIVLPYHDLIIIYFTELIHLHDDHILNRSLFLFDI